MNSKAKSTQRIANRFRGTVVVMAVNPFDGVRMADRQLAERLTAYAPVLYVEPPTSIVGRSRGGRLSGRYFGPNTQQRGPRLAVLAPDALPGLSRRGVAPANSRLVAAQVRYTVRKFGGSVRAVIDADVLLSIIGRCGESRSIYWAQDDFEGLAELLSLDRRQFQRAELRAAERADIIVAANPIVAAAITDLGHASELVPYGCDVDLFATSRSVVKAQDVALKAPMAVFVGHLGRRIDFDMLKAVADSGVSLLLVGPRHKQADLPNLESILEAPNVQWVGERPFETLPSYMAHGSVGLLPYTHSRFNQGSFPLKVLEYLAAGLPVVASSLPAVLWLESPDIRLADDPKAFAHEVADLVSLGRDLSGDRRRLQFASDHTWEARAARFAHLLGLSSESHPV